MSNIFRKEVIEYRKTQQNRSEAILPNMYSLKIFMIFLIMIIFMFVSLAIFGTYTEHKTVFGYLIPVQGIVKISSPNSGLVESIAVEEGKLVNAQQDILYIRNERFGVEGSYNTQLKNNLYNNIKSLENRRSLGIKDYDRTKALIENQKNSIEKEIRLNSIDIDKQLSLVNIAKDKYKRYNDLYKINAVSKLELDSVFEEVVNKEAVLSSLKQNENALNNKLYSKDAELENINITTAKLIEELNTEKILIENEVLNLESQQSTILRSPINGVVTNVYINKNQIVNANDLLLTIIPEKSILEGNLVVPSKDIGSLSVGDIVSIRYDAFPYQKYGQQQGVVKSISKNPVSIDKINELIGMQLPINNIENFYLVRLKIDDQYFLIKGDRRKLESGMTFTGDIKLRKMKLYQWIIEPLLDKRTK